MRRAFALYIAACFIWFAYDGTRVGWTVDDPMNLYLYWKLGLAKVVGANVTFWNGAYRPVGGLFYLFLYPLAGMNAAPYRWVSLAFLALNIWLVWKLARRLGGGEVLAGLAALFACVHGNLSDLIYNTSSIYDVLAVTFSLLAMLAYMRRMPFPFVLVLLILAVNAKEIAATVPAFFLLYEILFQARTLRRHAWRSLAALAVAGIVMYGKTHGADPMTVNDAYRPVFTFSRWLEANVAYTATLLYREAMPTTAAAGLWLAMALVTAVTRNRIMAWALACLALSTIPISFIPKRIGGSLYLPLIFAALWTAALCDVALARLPFPRLLPKLATVALAIGFWKLTAYGFTSKAEAWRQSQALPNQVLAKLRESTYRPPHGTRVLIVGSPYHDVFDMVFIASLVWNDPTLEITDANLTQRARDTFDVVYAFNQAPPP